MSNQKGSWIVMEKTLFSSLTQKQQQEIVKLIESDFRAAKSLYESYISESLRTNLQCKSSN